MKSTTARTLIVINIIFVLILVAVAAKLIIPTVSKEGIVSEQGNITVTMCPECEAAFTKAVLASHEPVCALYDVGKIVGGDLASVNASVITDDETKPAYGEPYVHSGLMHSKFCVLNNNTIITGSYNPTDGGEINRNNVLLITSTTLARNYYGEYEYLATGAQPHTITQVNLSGTLVENYFCPRDQCENHILAALSEAHKEVVFITYSFTSNPIGQLLQTKEKEGVDVEGVCDPRQNDAYSECPGLNAKTWRGPGLLHHKVFVIDGETVITGSYNPTSSADKRNNENVLIIHNATIAAQYLKEYASVLSQSE